MTPCEDMHLCAPELVHRGTKPNFFFLSDPAKPTARTKKRVYTATMYLCDIFETSSQGTRALHGKQRGTNKPFLIGFRVLDVFTGPLKALAFGASVCSPADLEDGVAEPDFFF